jgi:CheY-like chemotaxis protein/anti-anti-sigma regulatory factor
VWRARRGRARQLIEADEPEHASTKVIEMNGAAQDVLRLPGALDLAAAEGFLETIRQHLKLDRALCLDASEVETLTLPCIQIILAAVTSYEVSIVNPSDAFASAFRDLALDWNNGQATDGRSQVAAPAEAEAVQEPQAALMPEAATEPEPVPEVQLAPMPEPMCEPEPAQEAQLAQMPEPESEPMPEAQPVSVSGPAAEPELVEAPHLVPEPEPLPMPAPLLADEPAQEPVQESTQESAQESAPLPAALHIPDPNPHTSVAEQEPIHAPTDESPMSKRILTIDDSKTMRDMLLMTLVDAGFDVLQAVDGQDGLDVLGKERVDVVITDINMPIMDGYDVIRNLRKDPIHKRTPILVLTTESDTDKRAIARDAGATGWMVKPFDPDRLIATIRKVAP